MYDGIVDVKLEYDKIKKKNFTLYYIIYGEGLL